MSTATGECSHFYSVPKSVVYATEKDFATLLCPLAAFPLNTNCFAISTAIVFSVIKLLHSPSIPFRIGKTRLLRIKKIVCRSFSCSSVSLPFR